MFKNLGSAFSYFKLHWKCFSLRCVYYDVILFIFSVVLYSFFPSLVYLCFLFIEFSIFDSLINLSRYHFFRDLSTFISENGVDILNEYIERNH